jgi:DNA-binding FadR family transcriptional regulator
LTDSTESRGWRPVKKIRTHEQILEQIEEQIIAGQLKVGDRLPGERDLVGMLGVSRTTVREALRVLEALGIVVANAGTGKNSGSIVRGDPGPGLTTLLRLHVALAQFSMAEVIETRIVIERWSVTAASSRALPADFEELRIILETMKDPSIKPNEFNSLDAEFHLRLAAASHNGLLSNLMLAIRGAVEREMVKAFHRLDDWHQTARNLISEHEEILQAVEQGQADTASALVEQHISNFYGIHMADS